MKVILGIFCLIPLLINPVTGQELEKKTYKAVDSKFIKNLSSIHKEAEAALGLPVFLPTFIPVDQDCYAYIETFKGPWKAIISFSFDKTCKGVKVCTVGSLRIRTYGNPEMQKNMSGKLITTTVELTHNIKGYYTPGHSMGDYWPSSLQWSNEGVLYDLSWSGMDESVAREVLIDMANSVIHQSSKRR